MTSSETTLARASEDTGLAVLGDADAMRAKLKQVEQQRQVVTDYIADNFTKGIDFGPTDSRSDKPTLKKPGAEKICRMFNTRPTWRRDEDTWEMLGKPDGTVCYVCEIVDNATGRVVGEGRGAEAVGNKQRDANKAIKNAEKCALVDAALYTFCLSEKFTQDLGSNGANGAARLDEDKALLKQEVAGLRRGCGSSMTDAQFIVGVIDAELHKKRIDTLGECAHIAETIRAGKYDLSTAEVIPQP